MKGKVDLPMAMAIRQLVADVIGHQATIRRLQDGSISIKPKAMPLYAYTEDENLVLSPERKDDRHLVRWHQTDPEQIAELCNPDFRQLRAALEDFGYVDLWGPRD
jgi:hypothetical protein